MKKRVFSLLLTVAMILSAITVLTVVAGAETKHNAAKLQKINAMNALLIGVNSDDDQNPKSVSQWSDQEVASFIWSKLSWDPYNYDPNSYLNKLGLKIHPDDAGNAWLDAALVQKITKDSLGRDFPEGKFDLIYKSGDKVRMQFADGDGVTILTVQDYIKNGDMITAVGTAIVHYNPFSEWLGYFQAEFRENASSLYGLTLVSLTKIEGNQSFKLKAGASSSLTDIAGPHPASNVIDGKKTTAWAEAARGVGINEWILLETTDGSKMDLNAIEILGGYHKNDDILYKNGGPGKVRIECDGGYTQESWVNGEYDVGIIVLDEPQLTSYVRITILEAYDGNKYEDTCISEIRMRGLDTAAYFQQSSDPVQTPDGGTVSTPDGDSTPVPSEEQLDPLPTVEPETDELDSVMENEEDDDEGGLNVIVLAVCLFLLVLGGAVCIVGFVIYRKNR